MVRCTPLKGEELIALAEPVRDPDRLCITAAAHLLGVARSTFRTWIRKRLIASHHLPGARGDGPDLPQTYIRLPDLIAFAQAHDCVTDALDAAASARGVGLRPSSVLLLTADPMLAPALVHAGYDVTQAGDGFLAGLHLGRKRFDAALLDSGAEGWRRVQEWLTYHAGWVALGVLLAEDQPVKRGQRLTWQKPIDAARVAAELMEDLRQRRG
jgi:hypothetical protein